MKRAMRLIALVLFVSFCIVAALNINFDKNINSYTGNMTYKSLCFDFIKLLRKIAESTDSFIADSVSKAVENEDIVSENEGWHKFDEKAISYYFFSNANQWHYNPQLEKAAACAVKDYVEKIGLADEEWELIHMYSENGVVGVFARAKSYKHYHRY